MITDHFDHEGKYYAAVHQYGCSGCIFMQLSNCRRPRDKDIACSGDRRDDKRSVIWIEESPLRAAVRHANKIDH